MSSILQPRVTPPLRPQSPRRRPSRPYLHPALLHTAAWLLVALLYALHFSRILRFPSAFVFRLAFDVMVPFASAAGFMHLLASVHRRRARRNPACDVHRAWAWCSWFFGIWAAGSLFEIIISGGVPLIWRIEHSQKDYFQFGIHSLHGLLDSMLLAAAIISFYFYLLSRCRRFLWMPAVAFAWSVLVITRNMMVVLAIECVILLISVRGLRWRTVIGSVAATLTLVYVFGVVGNFRTGGIAFRNLAAPTEEMPTWLPSGFLWAYVYLTTPVNNLVYTAGTTRPTGAWTFPNTLAPLLPTVIRRELFPGSEFFTGRLVTQAFNVSTAYVGPYQDAGVPGMVLFAALLGAVTTAAWRLTTDRARVIYAVLGQCTVLSVFFNHFSDLAIITQVLWVALAMRGTAAPLPPATVAAAGTAGSALRP